MQIKKGTYIYSLLFFVFVLLHNLLAFLESEIVPFAFNSMSLDIDLPN